MSHFEDLTECKQGKNTFLAFDMEVGNALKKIYENDYEDETFILSWATNILRKDTFGQNCKAFERSFSTKCQDISLPPSFKLFINMLLQCPSIDSRKKHLEQPTLTISQLIVHSSIKVNFIVFLKLENPHCVYI